MQQGPTGQLFSGIKRPVAEALGLLQPHYAEISSAWRNRMALLRIESRKIQALSRLTLEAHHALLGAGRFDDYRQALERQAGSLARQGVPVEHALGALAFFFETCLSFLACEKEQGSLPRGLLLGMTRLISASELIVVAAYGRLHCQTHGQLRDRLRDTEQRLRNFSVHLMNISEQDRTRLSRDLHDEVGHNLLVLKLYMEMIALDLKEGKTAQGVQKLEEAVELTGQAIEGVRRLAFNLGPAILDEMGFAPSIRRYSRQFTQRTGIKVKVESARLPGALPSSYEVAFYRVFQGALSNVAAHAHAANVTVCLGRRRDSVFMVVEDDGVGFDLEKTLREPDQAFGLMAMRQRIELLGGSIFTESRRAGNPGGGLGRRPARTARSDSSNGNESGRGPGRARLARPGSRRPSGTRIEVTLPLVDFEHETNGKKNKSADLR